MKRIYCLLLVLLPVICCALSKKEADDWIDKAIKANHEGDKIVRRFNATNDPEERFRLAQEAIRCYDEEARCYDPIIDAKHKHKKTWHKELMEWIPAQKKLAVERRDQFQAMVNTYSDGQSASALYQEAVQLAQRAQRLYATRFEDILHAETCVNHLQEAGQLYEEAAAKTNAGLKILEPYPQENEKEVLKHFAGEWEALAHQCAAEATQWRVDAEKHREDFEQAMATYREGMTKAVEAYDLVEGAQELTAEVFARVAQILEDAATAVQQALDCMVSEEDNAAMKMTMDHFREEAQACMLAIKETE